MDDAKATLDSLQAAQERDLAAASYSALQARVDELLNAIPSLGKGAYRKPFLSYEASPASGL
jgi:hypothetical protein